MAQPYPISRESREEAIFHGDGGWSYGPFDLKIFDVEDIKVWLKAAGEPAWSPADPLITKTSAAVFDTFTIAFGSPVTVTTKIKVLSSRIHERSAGVTQGTMISPDALEKELTKQGTVLQELRRDAKRAVVAEFGSDPLTVSADLADGEVMLKQGNLIVRGPNAAAIAGAQSYSEETLEFRNEAEEFRDQAEVFAALARNNWVVAARFVGAGTVQEIELTVDPGTQYNMFVSVGGVDQPPSDDDDPAPLWELFYDGGTAKIRINAPLDEPVVVRTSNAVSPNVTADDTVSTVKIQAKAVTFAKIQDVSATVRILGRKTAGAGPIEELSPTDLLAFLPSGSVIASALASNAAHVALSTPIPFDDTVPLIAEGTQILTLTITPKSADSKFRVRWQGDASTDILSVLGWAMFQGGACIAAGYSVPDTAGQVEKLAGEVMVSPGTTSPITFSVRAGPDSVGKNMWFNGYVATRYYGGASISTLSVEEIKG